MPTPRRRETRAAREYVPARDLAAGAQSSGWDVIPLEATTPGLAERVARIAEDRKPRGCPVCEGPDAWGRPHDPACLLA